LAGFDIATQRDQVYLNMGICPQHDILWQDLTVEEHLLFYARLKGVQPEDEKEAVARAMEAVDLQDYKNRLSQALSGGQKRRLSIAIALTGNGKASLIFFSERP
jgi:ABC-type multidrug transport system ATPase subunit